MSTESFDSESGSAQVIAFVFFVKKIQTNKYRSHNTSVKQIPVVFADFDILAAEIFVTNTGYHCADVI